MHSCTRTTVITLMQSELIHVVCEPISREATFAPRGRVGFLPLSRPRPPPGLLRLAFQMLHDLVVKTQAAPRPPPQCEAAASAGARVWRPMADSSCVCRQPRGLNRSGWCASTARARACSRRTTPRQTPAMDAASAVEVVALVSRHRRRDRPDRTQPRRVAVDEDACPWAVGEEGLALAASPCARLCGDVVPLAQLRLPWHRGCVLAVHLRSSRTPAVVARPIGQHCAAIPSGCRRSRCTSRFHWGTPGLRAPRRQRACGDAPPWRPGRAAAQPRARGE